jgi:hypothetical protein
MRKILIIKKISLVVLVLSFSKGGYASPQLPDYMIYKGDTIALYHLLLEEYFEKTQQSDQGSLFGLKFRGGASTNCWRGYQAIYSIRNDSLFLNHIIQCGALLYGNHSIDHEDSRERISELFGKEVGNDEMFLDWYTGEFNLPKAHILRWDGVFHTTFEKETLFWVKEGNVKKISTISNYIDAPDRLNRRYQDTISTVLFNELAKIDWKNIDEFDCSERYLITISKSGRIKKVVMVDSQTNEEISEYWEKKEYNYCIRTIRKGLKHLKFDILKMNGQSIEEDVYLEIWMEENGKLENWTN